MCDRAAGQDGGGAEHTFGACVLPKATERRMDSCRRSNTRAHHFRSLPRCTGTNQTEYIELNPKREISIPAVGSYRLRGLRLPLRRTVPREWQQHEERALLL